MDLNLVVVCGNLAATPELREFDSGSRVLRLLVTTRIEEPRRRLDVIPVTAWDSIDNFDEIAGLVAGERVWLTGSLQRRFWDSSNGRRSRVELVASEVEHKVRDYA